MPVKQPILEIGFDKNGEAEFSVHTGVLKLSVEQMDEIRRMTVVGIGTMEDLWRRLGQVEQDMASQPGATQAERSKQ